MNSLFWHTNLFMARFEECKMTGSVFEEAQVTGWTPLGGDWSYIHMRHHVLPKTDFSGAKLKEADFYGCNLEMAKFVRADLTRVIFQQARLKGADLREAVVEGIDFTGVNLRGVRMDMLQAVFVARSYGALID